MFLCLIAKIFKVPANVVQDAESMLYIQFQSVDRNRYAHQNLYDRTIASVLVACTKYGFELDLEKLDKFIKRVFPNQTEYESTVSGIKYYQTELINEYKDIPHTDSKRACTVLNLK
ncbi:MAG: hypothetical protein EHM20_15895 [Alphaproteobacteria bacterium]|nr:MAG: hypothetical protein EHM20_15895 [Alphaproteobacteria bacterium]